MADGQVIIAIEGDDSAFQKEITSLGSTAQKRLGDVGKSLNGFGNAMSVGVTAPLLMAGKASVDMASDLSESLSKIDVVFGTSAASVRTWSEDSATAFGMSQEAALAAAGTYGNLFVSMGMLPGKSAEMSQSLVELAGDLASFNNVSPEEALDALRAGLVGETEPLKKFGVNMNEAALTAEAMKLGLSDGKTALDANTKAQAAYSLILAQTKTAQGDFARTSDGLANQERITAAETENAAAAAGKSLLPAYQSLTETVGGLASKFNELSPAQQESLVKVGLMLAAVGPLSKVIGGLATAISSETTAKIVSAVASKALTAGQWLLNAALSANPIGLVVLALAALVAGLVYAWQNSETFRRIVTAAWEGVKTGVKAVVDWFKGVPASFKTALGNLGNLLKDAGTSIVQGLWDGMLEMWGNVKEWVGGIAEWIQEHKGPISYDLTLLIENGEALMSGLGKGLDRGFRDVQSQIAGYNSKLVDAFEISPKLIGPAGSASVLHAYEFASPVMASGPAGGANITIAPGAITVMLPNGSTANMAREAGRGVLDALTRELKLT